MFTGLIDSLGTIRKVRRTDRALTLGITAERNPYQVKPGDSVACSGVCLTVESQSGDMLFFTAVHETLSRTSLAEAAVGTRVNLERAIRPADRLGGHIVLGHVDGVGRILGDRRVGAALVRTIQVPGPVRPFMAPKGSVAVDGVSLTIVESRDDVVVVSLVPYTLSTTTLGESRSGDRVNIECDVLARYIRHMMKFAAADSTGDKANLLGKMEILGF